MKDSKGRLVVVSNRLPVVINSEKEGLKVVSGSGGLVTALAPVLKNRGGIWIGWPGKIDDENQKEVIDILKREKRNAGFVLHPVFLSDEEIKLYYEGFSNEVIWPLFHDLPSQCHFNPSYWISAQEVSQKFAKEIFSQLLSNDFIWIHDYHLLLVGQDLRKLGIKHKIGFFLHIPFPPLDIFLKIPWRFQILRALLEYDVIGFQTPRDLKNFVHCVKKLLPQITIQGRRSIATCQNESREVLIAVFPISIDYDEFAKATIEKDVINQIGWNQEQLKGQKIIFSCDRLDISKGIPYRLKAIQHLLKKHPEIHGKVTFFQVVVPSRIEIEEYQQLKKEIDRLVGEINSEFTETGWVPIHYLYRSLSRKELLAFYFISEIALITPLKDGMNLVAKEYVASNVDNNGILILSEFAGAAIQFQHEAFLINPYDIEQIAETIYRALTLPKEEIKKRMRKMRRQVRLNNVYRWLKTFLQIAIDKELHDFPIMEEYTPIEPEEAWKENIPSAVN